MDKMINQRFGRLVIIEQVPKPEHIKSGGKYYLCQCDCGNQKIIRGTTLRSGATQSCGCLQKEKAKDSGNNLVGQTFSRLTVLKQAINNTNHRGKYWVCQCECGNITEVRGDGLISGAIKSCGCLQRESVGKNKIDEIGNTYGYLTVIDYAPSDNSGHARWLCRCKCGKEKTIAAASLRSGAVKSCGCIVSIGEQNIYNTLIQNNIRFQEQYSFKDLYDKNPSIPLRFDFAIFDTNNNLKLLIEFQGRQHSDINNNWYNEDIVLHDNLKKEYCKQHNLVLLEIPYYHRDKIDNYIQQIKDIIGEDGDDN